MLFQSLSSLGFALSLPVIVLMYLLKRTYIDTPVSSSMLWRKALREQEANRPWQRLRRQLLLLMQLLAALLLVLALMDPVVTGQSAPKMEAAIVLDTSASMTVAGEEGGLLLDAAKRELGRWLDEQSTASNLTLITTGEDPQIAASGSPRTIREALENVRPHYGPADIPAALTLADATLRGAEGGSVLFVTDGRAGVRADSLNLTKPLRVMHLASASGNASITAFGVRDRGDGERSAVVTIVNRGDQALTGTLTVEAFGEGTADSAAASARARVLQTENYALEPGQSHIARLDSLPQADYYRARIASGTADRYAADDTAYAVGSTGGMSIRALLVGGGNLFLDRALQLSGVQTVLANPGSFEPDEETMRSIDWVLVDGDVTAEDVVGEAWSRLLDAKPVWRIWSPASAESAATPAHRFVQVEEHPVVRYLTFQDVWLAKMSQTRAGEQYGDPIVTYGGQPAIYAGVADGKPGIVFAFDLRDTDLPLRPEFPILVAQAAEWMSGGAAASLGQATAGSRIDIQHRAESVNAGWLPVEVLGGHVAAASNLFGPPAGEQTVPEVPGLYRYAEYDDAGEALSVRSLIVVADPLEGHFAEMDDLGEGGSFVLEEQLSAQTAAQSLIPWIAALLLLFIAAEWEVYRRGFAS